MDSYSPVFARLYNRDWTAFAERVAPMIHGFYAETPAGRTGKGVLDLCCGTGQLALYFLDHGYEVTGLDRSRGMLEIAARNLRSYLDSGRARLVQDDAAGFLLDDRFGLVVSTYDSLNHLPDRTALRGCFESVARVLEPGGYFIFDLNTRASMPNWNCFRLTEREDAMIVVRGIYDESEERALIGISGFLRNADGLYERFQETMVNTVFDLEPVREMLLGLGWREVSFRGISNLSQEIANPEQECRVFIVARL
jgi:SAM-dependent methyltransferase